MITFERNLEVARKLADHVRAEVLIYKKGIFEEIFRQYDVIVAVFATGIVVREIAPLIVNKWEDPAIVVVDSNLNFAIPLLGGHHGANDMVRRISELDVIPVITTATEVHNKNSVEGIAKKLGYDIVNRDSTLKVNCALLDEDVEVLELKGPKIVIVGDDVSVLKKEVKEQ